MNKLITPAPRLPDVSVRLPQRLPGLVVPVPVLLQCWGRILRNGSPRAASV